MKTRLSMLMLMVFLAAFSQIAYAQDDEYVDPCLAEDAMMEESEEMMEMADNSDISFHIILPNARGDRSFIDSAAAGAERAIAELGVEGVIVETAGVQEHDAAMRRAVQEEPDLVVSIAVDASIVEEIVDEFPDQLFAAQETFFPAPPEYDNLAIFNILTHENSYLAGIAAGMLSRTGKVGAVGGGDFPGINLFIFGFEEGVMASCPDCEIVVSYVGAPTHLQTRFARRKSRLVCTMKM
ncbi:MAG: BMP family ABC transporter substrate-binding protein [Chloroflexota bacterium]